MITLMRKWSIAFTKTFLTSRHRSFLYLFFLPETSVGEILEEAFGRIGTAWFSEAEQPAANVF